MLGNAVSHYDIQEMFFQNVASSSHSSRMIFMLDIKVWIGTGQ